MNIKIATYNIHHGQKIGKIVENIKKLERGGIDIFCLQEVRDVHRKSNVLETCLKVFGDKWEHEEFLESGTYNFGLCLIWRKDIMQAQKVEKLILPEISPKNIRVLVKRIRKTLQRGALIGTFEVGGKILRVSNIHLDCAGQFLQRAKQITALTKHLKSSGGAEHEIICGDFNTIGAEVFSRKQEKKILEILGSNFKNAHPLPVPTFLLLQRLDYIFVKNLKVIEAKVLKLRGSDHLPLVATLKI